MGWLKNMKSSLLVEPQAVSQAAPIAPRSLDPALVREAAGVQRLAEIGPRSSSVLPAEAVLDPTALQALLRDAVGRRETVWFVLPEKPGDLEQLKDLFGPELMDLSESPPPDPQLPPLLGLKPASLVGWHLEKYGDPQAFAGLDASRLDRRVRAALLNAGTTLVRPRPVNAMLRSPQLPVYLVVFLYSALRALPVSFVEEFQGSLLVFWTLDVLTAFPYTWGVLNMLFGKKLWLRLVAAVVTVVTFVLPYVYFWMHGDDYPLYVPIVIAGLTILTVAGEVLKAFQERRLERDYRQVMGLGARHQSPSHLEGPTK